MSDPESPTPRDETASVEQPRAEMGSTLRSGRAWGVLLVTTVLGVVSDLVSKSIAFERVAGFPVHIDRARVLGAPDPSRVIPPHEPVVVVEHLLEFTLVLNPGAVFGIGAGQRWFFIFFTLAAVAIAIMLFARWTRPRDTLAHAGFGLIIAGGLGNLYDRIVFACVRDFIHPLPGVKLPFGITWPGGNDALWPYVSNVADLYLIIGIVLLVFYTWRQPDPGADPEPA